MFSKSGVGEKSIAWIIVASLGHELHGRGIEVDQTTSECLISENLDFNGLMRISTRGTIDEVEQETRRRVRAWIDDRMRGHHGDGIRFRDFRPSLAPNSGCQAVINETGGAALVLAYDIFQEEYLVRVDYEFFRSRNALLNESLDNLYGLA